MRIAILIGVKEYDNNDDLPGCINDVLAINDVLTISKEFNEIKLFSDRVDSDKLKSELSKLFADWKSNNVEELFFYFSGHGSFFQQEFYYLLSDSDENQRRQTSLQNTEVDSMIKSLKPKIVTKVIDACQSGVSYVKGDNLVEKYYKETVDNFNKCYFFHSSMTSQYSYQNDDLSAFTKSFLKSIYYNSRPVIRYKDILDYISDEFEKTANQTPFFVNQASFTESFIHSSDEIKKALSKYLKKNSEPIQKPELKEETKALNYIEKIKLDAESFATQEEVNDLLNNIKEQISSFSLYTDLNEIYELQSSFEYDLFNLPNAILIGRWVSENSHDYFAEARFETNSYKEEVTDINPFTANIWDAFGKKHTKTVTKYRRDLEGFEITSDVPFKYFIINYSPKFPNLRQYAFLTTFLISKKNIKIFYGFTDYKEKDWDRNKINKNFKWTSAEFLIKEEKSIIEFMSNTIKGIEKNIKSISEKKFIKEK